MQETLTRPVKWKKLANMSSYGVQSRLTSGKIIILANLKPSFTFGVLLRKEVHVKGDDKAKAASDESSNWSVLSHELLAGLVFIH